MREWCVLSAVTLLLLVTNFASCQNYPKAEIFGGYSFLHIDSQGVAGSSLVLACNQLLGAGTCPPGSLTVSQNFQGWNGAAQYNVNRWFSMAADFSGHYGTPVTWSSQIQNLLNANHISVTPPKARSYNYLFGPVISSRTDRYTVFGHALLGINDVSTTLKPGSISGLAIPGITASDSVFAGAFGGGIDLKVASNLALRMVQADYLLTVHDFSGGLKGIAAHQNNIRISAGIVYRFGESRAQPAVSPRERGLAVPSLGVRAVTPTEGGAEVIEVAPNSVAELAGLRVEDVIVSVDGKMIHSVSELATELANHAPGSKVKIGCLIQGAWHTEISLVLAGR